MNAPADLVVGQNIEDKDITPIPPATLNNDTNNTNIEQIVEIESSSSVQEVTAKSNENQKAKSAKKPSLMTKLKTNKLEPIDVVNQKKKASKKVKKGKKSKKLSIDSTKAEASTEDANEKVTHSSRSRNPLTKQSRIVFAAPQSEGQALIAIEYSGDNNSRPSFNGTYHDPDNNKDTYNGTAGNGGVHFEVVWRNLTYYHPEGLLSANSKANDKSKKRTNEKNNKIKPTLSNISGSIKSGQMTAIIGPSGAGKTTFLNCLAGFLDIDGNKNNTGSIFINHVESVKVGFVEQFDHLLPYLTVWETLMFASRIRNAARFYLNHVKIVNNLLQRLDLANRSQIRVARCSNGERKRLSIAIELVFHSDIIILDEPTSGLDIVTGHQIMRTMNKLVKRRPNLCVLATVHQPSSTMIELFDNLIVLSTEGTIIYQGSPFDIPQTLALVGLNIPKFYNMSDFLLEVASGDFGRQSLHLLVHYNKENQRNMYSEDLDVSKMCSLREAIKKANQVDNRSILLCTWLLFIRQVMSNSRNMLTNVVRFIASILISWFLSLLFTDVVGTVSTCPLSKYFFWTIELSKLMEYFEEQRVHSQENMAIIFILALVSMFASMLKVVVTFPNEVYVFRREYNNYSYSVLSYFIATILGDIPFDLPTVTTFTVIVHRLTGQIFNTWDRLLLVILPCCMITLIGQLIGMTLGVLFYKNLIAGLYAINFVIIPIILCSGFFKLVSNMSELVLYFSYISFMKPTVNAIMIAIYGLGRCEYEAQKEAALMAARNETMPLKRPRWIESLATLVEYQASLSNSTENEIYKNQSIEQEDKLIHYMGLRSGENGNRAYLLAYFDINDDYQAYWNEIENLLFYIILFALVLFVSIKLKIKRKV